MSDIDCFESPKHSYSLKYDITHNPIKLGIAGIAKSILKETNHSLIPDMKNGWKPKLPLCPLPLSYFNFYNQQLMDHIPTDDRFKIVFMGERYVNSVQINQKYSYFWKYRQRYSLNLALVQEAIKNVGNNHAKLANNILKHHNQKDLTFDSSFESANLQLAVKVKPNEYDLFLRSDTNTKGHTNWYYFKVSNKNLTGTFQFNICNVGKTKTLYNKGMKPFVLDNTQNQWNQDKTFDVCFVQRYSRYGFDRKSFQLQFKYNFKKPNSEVYFAYGIPYTYSRLQNFINQLTIYNSHLLKVQKICQSLGGLNIPLLTISDELFIKNLKHDQQKGHFYHPQKKLFDQNQQNDDLKNMNINNKKAVLITGRIHPGQSNSSYLLEGFIKELLKNDQVSKKIRQHYVFYIIPMLNPDGVVAGNFRTSYSGKDLNRQFKKLNKNLFPQITYLCQYAQKLKQKYKKRLQFYFDFHGHSSKKNLFCYGPQYLPSNILYFKSKTFAKILEQTNPIFSYKKSIFQISESKKATGRAYMLYNIKIPMTYTFQISNGLYETKQHKSNHLNEESLNLAGRTVFRGLCKYVRLQMASSTHSMNIKAKVDSGIRSKRSSSTQRMLRSKEQTLIIPRLSSSKQVKQDFQSIQSLRVSIDQKITHQANNQKIQRQFEKYMKEIKKQQPQQIQEPEGGSDSQGSQEDLSKEQLNKLQQFIESRNKQSKDYNKKLYNFKIKPVKKEIPRRKFVIDDENQNKQNRKTQNLRIKVLTNKSADNSRKNIQISQKSVVIKKQLPPTAPIMKKVALNQKNFTIQFNH